MTEKAEIQVQLIVNAVGLLLSTIDPEPVVEDAPDPGPRRTPRALRLWLARLRLLEAVPFSHLVADATLLPTESIRFFHVDRGWTDALVEGALSVGTVTTADRAALEAIYPALRAEVDEAERFVRLPGWEPGADVPSGDGGPITGFLLRSRLVSGWPALSVRGYGKDNYRLNGDLKANDTQVGMDDDIAAAQETAMRKLDVLRFERLAPAVLLVLFDGVPEVVHLEEPRAGVQFGFEDVTAPGGRVAMSARTRDVTNGKGLMWNDDDEVVFDDEIDAIEPLTVPVPFRKGAPGVVHFGELLRRLDEDVPKRPGDDFRVTKINGRRDAATLAMQLLQFPWRAVFGDQTVQENGGDATPMVAVFNPQIAYTALKVRLDDGPSAYTYDIGTVTGSKGQP